MLEFLVNGAGKGGWITVEELKEEEPKLLCDFLLKHI